eukprot:scaffold176_cov175-Ochromonas_danica.AAC.3
MSDFLSHCHNLQGVTAAMDYASNTANQICAILLRVLVEKLRENSLVKISLLADFTYHESRVMIANLLVNHASNLQYLNLRESMEIDLIISTLIENQNQNHLRRLIISHGVLFSNMTSSLISYLSSAGDLLEVLETEGSIDFEGSGDFNVDDLVVMAAKCCPKLTRFVIEHGNPCSTENLRQLFEQCPHLQNVSIPATIGAHDKNTALFINVKGSNDDWAVCLSHALRRRQYKLVTLRLEEDDYCFTVGNLKSLLEPYEIHLDGRTSSETSLITLLQDLPHVNYLYLNQAVNDQYTDAILPAFTKHAKCLTELYVFSDFLDQHPYFSDKVLSELIATCQSLKKLCVCIPILGSGFESVVAVSEHSSLNEFALIMNENISEEMLDELLLDENMQRPSTLKEGSIDSYVASLCYKFDEESLWWIKHW